MSKSFIPKDTAMGSKLRDLLPRAKHGQKRTRDIREPMPMPTGVDGTDHINIWDKGNTLLGQLLSHSAALSFTHSIFGRFSTVESFWHYIRSVERDDRIRTMSGITLKRFSEKLQTVRVRNFKAIIMDTNWQKIKQYPDLLEELRDSELPIECYYHYKREDGVRIRPNFSPWLILGFVEIRNALKENREPDFNFLKDSHDSGIYDFVKITDKKQNKRETKQFTAADAAETADLMRAATGVTSSVLEAVVSN